MEQTTYAMGEETVIQPSHTQIIHTHRKIKEPTIVLHNSRAYQKKKTIFRFYQIVWYVLGIIEVLLGFRFVLKAIAANPYNGFTSFIYGLSAPFILPFQGILVTNATGIYIVEWSTLIAMVVYLLIAYGIVELFQLVKPVNPQEVEQTVDEV